MKVGNSQPNVFPSIPLGVLSGKNSSQSMGLSLCVNIHAAGLYPPPPKPPYVICTLDAAELDTKILSKSKLRMMHEEVIIRTCRMVFVSLRKPMWTCKLLL